MTWKRGRLPSNPVLPNCCPIRPG